MNSEDLKAYKYDKISKLNFFTITMLSLHIIRSESKKYIIINYSLVTKLSKKFINMIKILLKCHDSHRESNEYKIYANSV